MAFETFLCKIISFFWLHQCLWAIFKILGFIFIYFSKLEHLEKISQFSKLEKYFQKRIFGKFFDVCISDFSSTFISFFGQFLFFRQETFFNGKHNICFDPSFCFVLIGIINYHQTHKDRDQIDESENVELSSIIFFGGYQFLDVEISQFLLFRESFSQKKSFLPQKRKKGQTFWSKNFL